MDKQLHLLDTPTSAKGHDAGAGAAKSARSGRPAMPAAWRLSAETRATGRRGIAQARAALEAAHRAGPDHRAA